MKDLVSDFIKGNSTQKLSIISNISTILGVSVATFVAGPFLSQFAYLEFIVADFIIAILFYFAFILLVGNIAYHFMLEAYKLYKDNKHGELVGNIILVLLVLWFILIIFPYAKYYTGNLFNNSYFLPAEANKAVLDISGYEEIQDEKILTVKGYVSFKEGYNVNDYYVVLYLKTDSGIYSTPRLTNGEYYFELGKNGKFTFPIDTQYTKFDNKYVVVYRRSDWSFFDAMGYRDTGFPNEITQVPNREIEELNAYVFSPKI